MTNEAYEAEQRRRLMATLHTVNTADKTCYACSRTRPATQYKCECGAINTVKR